MSRNDELNSRAEMIEDASRKAMPRDVMRGLQKEEKKDGTEAQRMRLKG